MEKPGGPEGAPRHLKPEKPDQSWILIKPVGDPKVARMARQRKRCVTPFPTFCEEIPRKYNVPAAPPADAGALIPGMAGAKMAMVPALAGTMGQWRLGWNPDGGAYCSLCN